MTRFSSCCFSQMKEAEQKKKEERRQELETIRIRQAADEIFRRNEEEKQTRKRGDNKNLSHFLLDQAVSLHLSFEFYTQ